jgi:hypothetical protein
VSELKPFELGIVILSESLVLLTLMGLVVRRHIITCRAFTLYLVVVLATDTMMLLDSFDTMAFWLLKELLLLALKFAIALELISRAFDRFPGARATAHRVMRLVLGLTLVMVIWVAAGWQGSAAGEQRDVATRIIGEFNTRILTATTWLYVAIAALILWYRLPMESMPKAILIGFVPYLIFFYMFLELWTANNAPKGGWLASLNTWAWPLLLSYWARSAWQPFRETMPRGASPVPAIQGSAG